MPDDDRPSLFCSWAPVGLGGALVHAVGELDMAGEEALLEAVREAGAHARLVVLELDELTFMDCAGVHVLLEAGAAARAAGHRLVVVGMQPNVAEVLALSGSRHLIDVLTLGESAAQLRELAEPPANPVNAAILTARVMAAPARSLWLQTEDERIWRVWAPPSLADEFHGRPLQVYLDADDTVNGWLDPLSMLAVNQRHLDRTTPSSAKADPMACQGACGIVWWVPAAEGLVTHDEHCLTCAGPLARG